MHRLGFELALAFGDTDVVRSPTTAWGPPPVGTVSTAWPAQDLFREIFRLSPFTAMFNVTGGPAISIPWSVDRDGLPIGMHLGAAPGRDEIVLAVAESLAREAPSDQGFVSGDGGI